MRREFSSWITLILRCRNPSIPPTFAKKSWSSPEVWPKLKNLLANREQRIGKSIMQCLDALEVEKWKLSWVKMWNLPLWHQATICSRKKNQVLEKTLTAKYAEQNYLESATTVAGQNTITSPMNSWQDENKTKKTSWLELLHSAYLMQSIESRAGSSAHSQPTAT